MTNCVAVTGRVKSKIELRSESQTHSN